MPASSPFAQQITDLSKNGINDDFAKQALQLGTGQTATDFYNAVSPYYSGVSLDDFRGELGNYGYNLNANDKIIKATDYSQPWVPSNNDQRPINPDHTPAPAGTPNPDLYMGDMPRQAAQQVANLWATAGDSPEFQRGALELLDKGGATMQHAFQQLSGYYPGFTMEQFQQMLPAYGYREVNGQLASATNDPDLAQKRAGGVNPNTQPVGLDQPPVSGGNNPPLPRAEGVGGQIQDLLAGGGDITEATALSVYQLAVDNNLTADQLAQITGVPIGEITKWLAGAGLNLQGGSVGLDNDRVNVLPSVREVQQNQTSIFQLAEMLKSNSPYITQARLSGERHAASRGGANSSIAGGAAEAAAIRAAQPFAINDANTYFQQSRANQDAENQALGLTAQLSQSQRENVLSNETSRNNAELSATVTRDGQQVSRANALTAAETQRLNQLASDENRITLQTISAESQIAVEEFRTANNIQVTDRNNRTDAFNQMIATIGAIESDPDLSVAQKNAGVQRTVDYYQNFVNYQNALAS